MNHHDEPFHSETVDEHIAWLVNGEKPNQPLPQAPGVPPLLSQPSERLVHNLRKLAQHDAHRLTRIRERLLEYTMPAMTSQETQAADHPYLTQHEHTARGVREIRPPFQSSASVPDLDTEKMLVLEPTTLRSRVAQQNQRMGVRHISRWVQTLAAVLILGVLIGSFITVLAVRNQRQQGAQGTPTQTVACQPYQLKQFDIQGTLPTSASYNTLSSISVISANDAWAVGYTGDNETFIEYWDGTSWRVVPSALGDTLTNNHLLSVVAVSAHDVWAAGYFWQNSAPGITPMLKTLVEHWDGTSWQVIPSPNVPGVNEMLVKLAVVSKNDIWAVGSSTEVNHLPQPLLEHWNGTSWNIVSLQGSATSIVGFLNGVVAISAHDIWAVGFGRNGEEQALHSLVMHWDGNQWRSEPAPPASEVRELDSISAISAQDLWSTGFDLNGHALIEHWDGQQWKRVVLPAPWAGLNVNLGITVVSAKDMWALGSSQGSDQVSHLLILHWNGTIWQQVPTPVLRLPDGFPNTSASGIAVSGGQIWIIGNAGEPSDQEGGHTVSFILGQRTCP